MSDELLRTLAVNGSALSDVRVIDPKYGSQHGLYVGQCSRLLQCMCHHANIHRVVFVGQHTLEEETGLNGQSIETHIRRLITAGFLIYLGKKSYKGSKPVNNYYINLPYLDPIEGVDLELLLATPVADRLAMFSKEALKRSLGVSLDESLPVRDKQEQEPKTKECKRNQEQEDEPSSEELNEILNLMSERYGRYD